MIDPSPDTAARQRARRRRARTWLAGVAVLAAGLAAGLAACWAQRPEAYEFASEPLSGLRTAEDFTLQSAAGPVRLSQFDGDVVVLFFGYTHCPDVCPTQMMHLAQIHAMMSAPERQRVHVAMISVDPERDTPEVMGRYARAFSPDFLGLTGTPEAIAEVAKRYYVVYDEAGPAGADQYVVQHTAAVYVLNTRRQLELIYSVDQLRSEQRHVADDLRRLLTVGG